MRGRRSQSAAIETQEDDWAEKRASLLDGPARGATTSVEWLKCSFWPPRIRLHAEPLLPFLHLANKSHQVATSSSGPQETDREVPVYRNITREYLAQAEL